MSVIFCPKCHKEACKVIRSNGAIEVTQGSQTLMKIQGNSPGGGSFNVRCPSGHLVRLALGEIK